MNKKKDPNVFKSGGNILDQSASQHLNKLFITKSKYPLELMEFNDKQLTSTL